MGQGKQRAHELALEWWKSSGRDGGACDKCNANISLGEGYLCKPALIEVSDGKRTVVFSSPDLLCESCFDRSPTAAPFESRSTPPEQGISPAHLYAERIAIRRIKPWMRLLVLCVGMVGGVVGFVVAYRSYSLLFSAVVAVIAFYLAAGLTGLLIEEVLRTSSAKN